MLRGSFFVQLIKEKEMKAIKKINNNVAICLDGNQKELVAFGKGIGFPTMPYEITDLNKITMTFYKIDQSFYQLVSDIPDDILEISALITLKAQVILECPLNPNLVVGLADHINFSIIRLRKFKKMKMLFSYDIEHLYPKETELGKYAVNLIWKRLHVKLPDSEITSIAIHFVNAEEEHETTESEVYESLIIEIIKYIEKYFETQINEKDFNYNRFVMHLRYYFQRIQKEDQFFNSAKELIEPIKNNHPQVYECANDIAKIIEEKLQIHCTEDEKVYLMIHVYRIITNQK